MRSKLGAIVLCIAALLTSACQGDSATHSKPPSATVSAPPSSQTNIAGPSAPIAGTGGATIDTAPASNPLGSAGQDTSAVDDNGTSGSDAGITPVDDSHDHCINGEPADMRDAQLSGEPDEWKSSSGEIDLVVPQSVLAWMGERVWEPSHDAWHNVRRCKSGGVGFPGLPTSNGSTSLCDKPELVPEHQECTDAEDGYAFLVMHRHMMQALRHAFPQHTELFAGFPHFPLAAQDVPEQWRGRWGTGWSASILDVAKTLEDIESNLSQFPTEGDLGKFIQCGGMSNGASSIHGALHFKWVVNESPYSLGKQPVNIDNYMFWKLHGWLDSIWERYRTAKGLTDDEPKLVQALVDQCREMHELGHAVSPTTDTSSEPLPVEHGFFHEMVRPILEQHCSSCHGETSPEASMALGGHISSADIVKGLLGVPTMHGGQFKRVVAGDPNQSWLYLKPAGLAVNAGCSGASCNTQVMPPTGQVTLSQAELNTLQQWISDGAAAPTQ